MRLFENDGTRSDYLERAYSFLKTVKPTSVEAERPFSSAGLYGTKIRNRLGHETLDAFCILKSHFKAHEI